MIGIGVGLTGLGVLGHGGGIAQESLIVLDGEQATLVWDGTASSQVRFYDITAGEPGTQVGTDQTAAPYSVQTGNLTAEDERLYRVEVDGIDRAHITVYVMAPLAFGVNVGTASSAATGITQLDATISNSASPIAADSEWLLIRVVNSSIGTTYGTDNNDVTGVVVDPGGAAIAATKIWEGTAGFSAEGSGSFGITAGLWLVAHDSSIADSTTVRVSFTGAGAEEATVSLEKLTKDPRTTIVVGTPADAYSAEDTREGAPPVSEASESTVAQRLWAYHFGREGGATDAITYDAAWTSFTPVTVGSVWAAVGNRGAYRIAESLSSGDPTPSDPGANTEYATVMVGIEQQLDGETVPAR
jgi:hypothetical protein